MNELIRERIDRNRFASGGVGFSPLELLAKSSIDTLDYQRKNWSLTELLRDYDKQFVDNAYLVLLKRNCDVDGLESRLNMLRSGEVSRVEMLFRLRYGSEGRQHQTRVRGLVGAFVLDKVVRLPIIGWVPRFLLVIFKLPSLHRDLEEIRGLIAMQKNESDSRDEKIVEFQNFELEKIRKRLDR